MMPPKNTISLELFGDALVPEFSATQFNQAIQQSIQHLFSAKKAEMICEINFVNAKKMARLNRQYRGKPDSTDVLSFPIWESKKTILKDMPTHLGSIVINADLLPELARNNHHSVTAQAIKLAQHAILHLAGQHHKE